MLAGVVSRMDELESLFAERLFAARELRGLSQAELAKMAGLQPAAIGHFERDRRKPSFANVRALARALNVASDYLLGRSESMEGATTAFRDEDKLTNADREHIQMMIDLMNQRKAQKDG
jgi:transcriptional regulator with XRE-family HTH domain